MPGTSFPRGHWGSGAGTTGTQAHGNPDFRCTNPIRIFLHSQVIQLVACLHPSDFGITQLSRSFTARKTNKEKNPIKLNKGFPFAQWINREKKSPVIHGAMSGNTFGYNLCFHTNGELRRVAQWSEVRISNCGLLFLALQRTFATFSHRLKFLLVPLLTLLQTNKKVLISLAESMGLVNKCLNA